MIRFLVAVRGRPRLRLILAIVLLGLTLVGCREEPQACGGGEGSDRPTFAATDGGDGGSCEVPPCEDCGSGTGDPHVKTFDGHRYDYQGVAEVVAARASDGSFEVQWRTEPRGTRASSVTAVAMSIADTRITFVGEENVVLVAGDPLDDAELTELASGVTIYQDSDWVIVIGPDGDGSVHMSRRQFMAVLVDPPDRQRGSLEGLLGDADGDSDNDRVSLPEREDDFHLTIGETWRVDNATTLFDYPDGLGPDDFWDPDFPYDAPPRTDQFSDEDRRRAEEKCRAVGVTDEDALADCIYDYLLLGDAEVIEEASLFQDRRTQTLTADASTIGTTTTTTAQSSGSGIAVGREITGEISDEGEMDFYSFDLDEGQIVYFEGLLGDACERGNVRWRVNGPNGSGEHDICVDIGRFTAEEAGTYEVAIRGAADRGTGPYQLTIREVPADQVMPIEVGDDATGDISQVGERHFYSFDLDEGQIVYFEGLLGDACERGNVRWRVNGPNGSGEHDICVDIGRFTAEEAGTYEVAIRGAADRGTGPYQLTIREE